MKDSKHKLLTLAALTTIAAGVVHVANRVIVASSQLKEMLDFSNHNYYDWRFGKIYYTKKGSGSPLLLIHDTMPGASGYGFYIFYLFLVSGNEFLFLMHQSIPLYLMKYMLAAH